jgi:hypothetical protein
MFYAGLGRGARGGAPEPSHTLTARDYLVLPLILPPYALGMAAARLQRAFG